MRQCYRKNNAINGKTFPFLDKPPGVILGFLIIRSSTRWRSGALIIIPRSRLWNNLSSGVDRLMIIDLQLPKAFMLFEVTEEGESAGRWQIRCRWTTHQISLCGSNVTKTHCMFALHLSASPVCIGRRRKQTVKPAELLADSHPESGGGGGLDPGVWRQRPLVFGCMPYCNICSNLTDVRSQTNSWFYPMLGVLEGSSSSQTVPSSVHHIHNLLVYWIWSDDTVVLIHLTLGGNSLHSGCQRF